MEYLGGFADAEESYDNMLSARARQLRLGFLALIDGVLHGGSGGSLGDITESSYIGGQQRLTLDFEPAIEPSKLPRPHHLEVIL